MMNSKDLKCNDVKKTTVIMPVFNNLKYAYFALESIQKHSNTDHNLVLILEPISDSFGESYITKIQNIWRGSIEIIRNDTVKGYYSNINTGVVAAKTDTICMFTSDQVAAANWDTSMFKHLKPKSLITGRLVESGACLIADGNIHKNFGKTLEKFNQQKFDNFVKKYKPPKEIDLPHHYIPCLCYKQDFLDLGGFEQGKDSDKKSTHRGDYYFFIKAYKAGYQLVEVQRIISYHFQNISRSNRSTSVMYTLLNYAYGPLLLKYLHREATGFINLYDTLKKLQHDIQSK